MLYFDDNLPQAQSCCCHKRRAWEGRECVRTGPAVDLIEIAVVGIMQGGLARRRLLSLANQLLSPKGCAAAAGSVRPAASDEEIFGPQKGLFSSSFAKDGADPLSEARLKELFGDAAYIEGPLAKTGFGRRFHNVDLSKPLSAAQAAYVVDALSVFSLISFPKQDLTRLSLGGYERFANHFGAVQPMYAEQETDSNGFRDRDKAPLSVMRKVIENVNSCFPGQVQHLSDRSPSPAIATITNMRPRPKNGEDQVATQVRPGPGGYWHTDQDHERISCAATMFLVQKSPTARDPESGTWIKETSWDKEKNAEFYTLPGAPDELRRLRNNMSLNGETPFADTAAAFAALPKEEQERLEKINLIKYKQQGDDVLGKGYYCPLVRTNPRSGVKAFYSPVYGNRTKATGVPPAEIEGMTKEETKALLDRLEAHCLKPEFRYNHLHQDGDLVVWNDYALLHAAPPVKIGIRNLEDARLYYRIATKGRPELTLPRKDDPAWLQENFTSTYTTSPEIIRGEQ